MKSTKIDHFTGVDFHRFKAFQRFSLELRRFSVLVGPNNAGKSTVLVAFRILAAGLRRATTRKAEVIRGPTGQVMGHRVDLPSISVAEENLFFNYNDDEPAWIRFRLQTGHTLLLYFPEREVCYLIPDAQGKNCTTPAGFKANFRCSIGFVPILGPVEHKERLYEKEAARLALFNYGAARNFRNIWYHFPDDFDAFRELIQRTWPGMDVTLPERDTSGDRTALHMWCPENRLPREISWAGFGFQVWCQMLTHLIQSKGVSLFLIDEPDIYLHSDLQRQLLGILRELGPDVVLATHSTEIITEADTDEIVVVDKHKNRAVRLRSPTQLENVFRMLGSAVNPVLTQIAKTKRVVFVEGQDFQLLGRFARKSGFQRLANRSDFAVVSVDGFNPEKIRILKKGMESTLGVQVSAAAILDRDYRPKDECIAIMNSCETFCNLAVIHDSKEIENFLLIPEAIDRAALARLEDRAKRGGAASEFIEAAKNALDEFANSKRHYVFGKYLECRRRYARASGSEVHESQLIESEMKDFETRWENPVIRMRMIPGKDALAFVNKTLQDAYNISLTPFAIVESMKSSDVPVELRDLLIRLEAFTKIEHTSA